MSWERMGLPKETRPWITKVLKLADQGQNPEIQSSKIKCRVPTPDKNV